MQSYRFVSRPRKAALFFMLVLMMALPLMTGLHQALAAGNVGYKDFSYSGVTAPTGQKPQSKLWFNDGLWWGVLYNRSNGRYEIYRFNWANQNWTSTGTPADTRSKSSADALWDGAKLFMVSAVPPGTSGDVNIKVYRYSYNAVTKTYAADSGFPVNVISAAVETVVMDKDTTGKLWLTYTRNTSNSVRAVYVTRTSANDQTWVTPFIIPVTGANNLDADDISTLVAYNGKIGVMWSNQTDNSVYFAFHTDGAADNLWSLNPAVQGPKYADDHINIKSLQADASGQVFAAVKTSLNDINPSTSNQPLILLLTLGQNGSWSRRTFGRVVDDHTRPIVLIDNQNRMVYVLATIPVGSPTSGAIYYKSVSLDNPSMQFVDGKGTPFIEFSTDTHVNNVSSTKQPLNSTTGLLAIAGDDTSKYYFHNTLTLGGGTPPPTPTFTATATATATATFTPTPTNTATSTPTPTDTPVGAPTNTPTNTPLPTDTPTNTPVPTEPGVNTDTPTPTATIYLPLVLFGDGFESGTFAEWSVAQVNGDGQALVQTSQVRSGNYAALLSATSNSGSAAYLREYFSSIQTQATISGDFMVLQEGASGANVPIFRLFDSNGKRIVNFYRQNQDNGSLWFAYGSTRNRLTSTLPLNTWTHFDLKIIDGGAGLSTVEIYINGALIYNTSTASLGSSGLLAFQIGNDTARQTFQLAADNISATAP